MGSREDDDYWNDKYDGHTHCLHYSYETGGEECCQCEEEIDDE